MRTKLFYTGYTIGFDWGLAYATGTRATRRSIRRKLTRMGEVYSQFVEGIWTGFGHQVDQHARAILDGLAPRTINPHKLRRVLDRV